MVKGKDLSDIEMLNVIKQPNTVPSAANCNDPDISGQVLMDLSKNIGGDS